MLFRVNGILIDLKFQAKLCNIMTYVYSAGRDGHIINVYNSCNKIGSGTFMNYLNILFSFHIIYMQPPAEIFVISEGL